MSIARNRPVLDDGVAELWDRHAARNGQFLHGIDTYAGASTFLAGGTWATTAQISGIIAPGSQLDTPDSAGTLLLIGFRLSVTPSGGGSDPNLGVRIQIADDDSYFQNAFIHQPGMSASETIKTVSRGDDLWDTAIGAQNLAVTSPSVVESSLMVPYMVPLQGIFSAALGDVFSVSLQVKPSTDLNLAVANAMLAVATA